ncbi:MAG: amidohydrolase family protein, partial [Deltaproteobacteria bacterium]|nr:amidohydrolase family protein [Deltaproteobacteria bacterium]
MIPDDLIIRGGTVLNLEGRTLHAAEVLIRGGVITEVGAGPLRSPPGCPVLEAQGQLISPGFMDAHLHIESALLSPQSFARAALIHGTTAVFVDPHELANVLGELGVTLFLEQAKTLPMDMFVG